MERTYWSATQHRSEMLWFVLPFFLACRKEVSGLDGNLGRLGRTGDFGGGVNLGRVKTYFVGCWMWYVKIYRGLDLLLTKQVYFVFHCRLVNWFPDMPADIRWMQEQLCQIAGTVYSQAKSKLFCTSR